MTPDATGYYFENGTNDDKPAYERKDGAYWLWWLTVGNTWTISTLKATLGDDYWSKTADPVAGEYTPSGGATGTATVAAVP